MSLKEDNSNAMLQWPYTQSPWDGDLKPELRKWGYLNDDKAHEQEDSRCNFAAYIADRGWKLQGCERDL